MKKRKYYLYVLRDGREVVYYGVTQDRERSVLEQEHMNKHWTNYSIIKGLFQRDHAEREEKNLISFYQDSHEGKLPKYNS